MQFIDLKAQQDRIRDEIKVNIDKVLTHGKYIMGPEVLELENKLAGYVGVRHCISCASGTDAILMALMAKGIGPGDAVFTTPFTFIATAEVISLLGATPVFVDIDERTFNLDPVKLETAIKEFSIEGLTPKAVIPVDLFGLPADFNDINRIANENNLIVIEDAAQGLGGIYNGKKACSLGDIGTTSFFPAKPLGCYGDGGAIFTNDDEVAEILKSIRVHGKGNTKYDNVRIGINGRLDTIQAAILLPKLSIFEDEIEIRQAVARKYMDGLGENVINPFVPEGYRSAWAQYTIMTDRRVELMEYLKDVNVPFAIYYPKPLHLQDAFRGLGYLYGDFLVSERCSERVVSLPIHPYLSNENQLFVVENVCK